MWCLGTWISGGPDHVRLMVGLDDLKDLLQPKWCYDSISPSNMAKETKKIQQPQLNGKENGILEHMWMFSLNKKSH